MESICGANCDECSLNKTCKGCKKTKGCHFGKQCFIANYILVGGMKEFESFKNVLIDEFNSLNIDGMPKINELYPLNGSFINLKYPLPNGNEVKFLDDKEAYLGNQVECIFNDKESKKYFGLVANMSFILVCEYEENCKNPKIIIYKSR